MSFQITLMRCTAEPQRVNKSGYIHGTWTCEGSVKEQTSILRPSILIEKNTPPQDNDYNYLKISAFGGRYYFIEDIEVAYNGMWLITAKCDVLFSHRTDILNSKCILDKTEELKKSNLYFDDGSFIMDSRKYNKVMQFPYGLPQEGYNILICAGGV